VAAIRENCEADIGKVQIASAAIRAGINIQMAHVSLKPNQLGQVILAGGFGSYVSLISAVSVGMLPAVPDELITQVGNAAVIGAKLALLMGDDREPLECMATALRHIDLATFPGFKGDYTRALRLP
jgi:uncharacterized 2Fe-2S/4Fe-4S cluster protein (DUF4445 family)